MGEKRGRYVHGIKSRGKANDDIHRTVWKTPWRTNITSQYFLYTCIDQNALTHCNNKIQRITKEDMLATAKENHQKHKTRVLPEKIKEK